MTIWVLFVYFFYFFPNAFEALFAILLPGIFVSQYFLQGKRAAHPICKRFSFYLFIVFIFFISDRFTQILGCIYGILRLNFYLLPGAQRFINFCIGICADFWGIICTVRHPHKPSFSKAYCSGAAVSAENGHFFGFFMRLYHSLGQKVNMWQVARR